MNVLIFTSLFPNHLKPNNGIFIKNRMYSFAEMPLCNINIIAPVPFVPIQMGIEKWDWYGRIRKYEILEGQPIYHPKYFMIPKIGMQVQGLFMFLSSYKVAKAIDKKVGIDLIDGHYIYPDGFAAALLKKTIKKPLVLSARGSDINQFTKLRTIVPLIKYALKNADHIISVCKALKDEMIKLGINDNKISVIPNGVDTEKFTPVEKKKARERLNIREEEKIILTVGSLIERKGMHLVLDALPMVIEKERDVKYIIVGEGPLRRKLEEKIENLGLKRHVRMVGEIENDSLPVWYSCADLFVLTSSREGWANVIMESLACGTPVVATGVWGAPEIITSPSVGNLVNGDKKSIGEALISGLKKEWNREEVRKHVESRTWESVGREVKKVFENVVNQRIK